MTKTEFNEKFHEIQKNFFDDPKTEEIFASTINGKAYTVNELIPVLMHSTYQLSAKFTFDVLSQVLEFDEE